MVGLGKIRIFCCCVSLNWFFLDTYFSDHCPEPGGLSHAVRSGDVYPYEAGSTITYTCNDCYDGGGDIECQRNGFWTMKTDCTSES